MAISIIQRATGSSNGTPTVVTLPSPTTAGNSLVVLLGQWGAGGGGIFGLTDTAGDTFQDVDSTVSVLPTNDIGGTVDIWWCRNGNGGATSLLVNAAGGPAYVWVYEVSPLVVREVTKFSDSFGHDVPVVGATLTAADSEDIYFEVVTAGLPGDITPPGNNFGSVSGSWILDPTVFHDGFSAGSRTTAYATTHLISTGTQTPIFTLLSPTAGAENWVAAGVVFAEGVAPVTIIVQKVTSPTGAPQAFTFRPSWKAPFVLIDGQSNSSSLDAGTYTISEDSVLSWSTVVTGGNPNNIVLGAGETITLIFTNTFSSSLPVCYADGIIPTGAIDGVNTSFTLPNAPSPPGSLILESDTSVLAPGVGFDLSFVLNGAQLTLTYPPKTSLVAWYRFACGSQIPPLYKLNPSQAFDDNAFTDTPTAINSTYFTYGFVNAAKSAQNPLLGFHRKRFTEIQLNVNGSGQFTVETFPNYILKQDLSYNPYAYVVPPILLQTDPPDDIIRPLNSVGNRVYVMFQTNMVGASFDISKTILVGVMDGYSVVNPNSG